ncbi:MAG TPA: Gfo/Idh/MocA family oxidoreductase [Chryseolinea sp.]|nr:Gfo/Idh/MocA family oxidoreductase [Chryseolinea sp.]
MKAGKESSFNADRRKFLQHTGAVIGGMALPISYMDASPSVANVLKVGLIGCGGRGSGAAGEALAADPDAILTAMGDVFSDRLDESYEALMELYPAKVKVNKENKFVGFDAYQKVINSGVDVVLLTTPPAFRPDHLTAAVNAGKHAFCEKPVAIDAPGVRKVLAAAKKAKEKKLSVVSGFCFRYDNPKRELFKRIHNGDIGEIKTVSTIRNGGPLWTKPRQPGWTDMEYKLRNWLYYSWLSGDFISEMMVHSLDLMSWTLRDKTPLRATGTGGRQVRTEEVYGNVYDHFAIEFEYPNDVRGFHFSRQLDGCSMVNKVEVAGTLGNALIGGPTGHEITGKNTWKFTGERNNMYQTEHDELFASIRSGKPMNDGDVMAQSSMLGVLGRMAAYTGQTISWEDALNSNQALGPAIDQYSWDLKWPGAEVARPGITKLF